MKQGSNRRSRSRGGGKRGQGGRGHNFESSGPEMKIRGSAQQLQEKYLAMARDAYAAGDRIAAESYFQHADHYYRVLNPDGNGAGRHQQQHPQQNPQQHQQHPQRGPDPRGDGRPPQQPPGTGPQPVIEPAAAIVARPPERKEGEAPPAAAPATVRGQG